MLQSVDAKFDWLGMGEILPRRHQSEESRHGFFLATVSATGTDPLADTLAFERLIYDPELRIEDAPVRLARFFAPESTVAESTTSEPTTPEPTTPEPVADKPKLRSVPIIGAISGRAQVKPPAPDKAPSPLLLARRKPAITRPAGSLVPVGAAS